MLYFDLKSVYQHAGGSFPLQLALLSHSSSKVHNIYVRFGRQMSNGVNKKCLENKFIHLLYLPGRG